MATAAALEDEPRYGYPPFPVKRFSVRQYHRMLKTGILREGERVELLEGWIVQKMTHHPPHASAVSRLARRLERLLPEEWVVRIQVPISFTQSEPEPDVVIARGPEDLYDKRHPTPKEVGLLVEVADTSLAQDQGYKLQLYARRRIVQYWIVNLIDQRVEVYTQPRGGRSPTYLNRQAFGPDARIPVVLDDHEIGTVAVREILTRS